MVEISICSSRSLLLLRCRLSRSRILVTDRSLLDCRCRSQDFQTTVKNANNAFHISSKNRTIQLLKQLPVRSKVLPLTLRGIPNTHVPQSGPSTYLGDNPPPPSTPTMSLNRITGMSESIAFLCSLYMVGNIESVYCNKGTASVYLRFWS